MKVAGCRLIASTQKLIINQSFKPFQGFIVTYIMTSDIIRRINVNLKALKTPYNLVRGYYVPKIPYKTDCYNSFSISLKLTTEA